MAVVFAVELDEFGAAHGLSQSLVAVVAVGGDTDDTTTSGDGLALCIEGSAGVEEDALLGILGRSDDTLREEWMVETRHHLALLVGTRITATDQDNGDSGARVFDERLLVERAVGHTFE